MAKKQIGKRRTGIRWDYNGDGRFEEEQWTSSDKRYWSRWLRRLYKEEAEKEIKQCEIDFTL